jgi:hypothetical protein
MDERTDLGLPPKMALSHRGSYIEIVRKWFGLRTIATTISAMLMPAIFFVFMYPKGLAAIPHLFLLFLGAGFCVTAYTALAGWVNHTHITVGQGKLQIRHAPLPWPGNRIEDSSNLKQLFAKEVRGQKNSVTYELHAITRDERTIKLVGGLESSEQAHYIERQVEKYLGIEDAPVKGEIGH